MTTENQVPYTASTAPVGQLNTNRGLLKFILLSIITLGIYAIVFYSGISNDINIAASRYDGKKTMHFCLLIFLITPITFGIGTFVWYHKMSNRIGNEARRRGLSTDFGAGTYWLWNILGSLIIVGPFVYLYKLASTMNMVCSHYNTNG